MQTFELIAGPHEKQFERNTRRCHIFLNLKADRWIELNLKSVCIDKSVWKNAHRSDEHTYIAQTWLIRQRCRVGNPFKVTIGNERIRSLPKYRRSLGHNILIIDLNYQIDQCIVRI